MKHIIRLGESAAVIAARAFRQTDAPARRAGFLILYNNNNNDNNIKNNNISVENSALVDACVNIIHGG